MKSTFSVLLFIMLHKVVLTFESVDDFQIEIVYNLSHSYFVTNGKLKSS